MKYTGQLKLSKQAGRPSIYCMVRKKWLVYAPEELVRQLTILYLTEACAYPLKFIAVERGVSVYGQQKRWDILVYNQGYAPALMIECKAASVALNQGVFDQVAQYNTAIKVPYLMIINGPKAFVAKLDYSEACCHFELGVPTFEELSIKNP